MLKLSPHIEECQSNPKNMKIVCEFCNVKLAVEEHKEHLDKCEAHPDAAKIVCEFCNGKLTLRKHHYHFKKCRANPDNIKVKCEHCGKKYNGNYYEKHAEQCAAQKNQKENDDANKECSICLLELLNNNDTVFLSCIHKFHRDCIAAWAKKQNACPICRIEFQQPLQE
jgi:hypothetical protein